MVVQERRSSRDPLLRRPVHLSVPCVSPLPFPMPTHRGFLRSLTSRRAPLPLDNRRGSRFGINLLTKKKKEKERNERERKETQSRAYSFVLEWNPAFVVSFAEKEKKRSQIRGWSQKESFTSKCLFYWKSSKERERFKGIARPSVICTQNASMQRKSGCNFFKSVKSSFLFVWKRWSNVSKILTFEIPIYLRQNIIQYDCILIFSTTNMYFDIFANYCI